MTMMLQGLSVVGDVGTIVAPVDLELRAGTALTLLGESGSGKSLLAHAVMGTLPAGLSARGRITVGGVTYDAADSHARRGLWGRTISLLPQEPWFALDPTMRAGDQLALTHRYTGRLGRGAAWHRALDELRALGVAHAAASWPSTLSGGMAQRVAFAITRAGAAPVLIVDEPTKGLDSQWRDETVSHLRAAVDEGCAVLVITHDIAVARALGGRVGVMLDGRLVEQGDMGAVLAAPVHDCTRALIEADPARWQVPTAPTLGDEVIAATGLSKRFGGRILFRDLSLTLRAGERVAVTGASGSGKSTLGNVLLGLVASDAGNVRRAAGSNPVRYQKLYQDPLGAFAPTLTIGRALQDLVKRHAIDPDRLSVLMARLKLVPALLARFPASVSGGELQRFALLRVLLLRPAFLFADEPTSRLDPVTQKQTIALLLETMAEMASALMLVTHDPGLAEKVAGRRLSF